MYLRRYHSVVSILLNCIDLAVNFGSKLHESNLDIIIIVFSDVSDEENTSEDEIEFSDTTIQGKGTN